MLYTQIEKEDLNLSKIVILLEKFYFFNNKYILSISKCDLFNT